MLPKDFLEHFFHTDLKYYVDIHIRTKKSAIFQLLNLLNYEYNSKKICKKLIILQQLIKINELFQPNYICRYVHEMYKNYARNKS